MVGPDGASILSGPSSNMPVYYDFNGSPCGGADSATCPFEVSTSFSPHCAIEAGSNVSCAQALWIDFNVLVAPNRQANSQLPANIFLANKTFTEHVNVTQATGPIPPIVPLPVPAVAGQWPPWVPKPPPPPGPPLAGPPGPAPASAPQPPPPPPFRANSCDNSKIAADGGCREFRF